MVERKANEMTTYRVEYWQYGVVRKAVEFTAFIAAKDQQMRWDDDRGYPVLFRLKGRRRWEYKRYCKPRVWEEVS